MTRIDDWCRHGSEGCCRLVHNGPVNSAGRIVELTGTHEVVESYSLTKRVILAQNQFLCGAVVRGLEPCC